MVRGKIKKEVANREPCEDSLLLLSTVNCRLLTSCCGGLSKLADGAGMAQACEEFIGACDIGGDPRTDIQGR